MNFFICIFYAILLFVNTIYLSAETCINGGNSEARFQYSAILTDEHGQRLTGFQTVLVTLDLYPTIDGTQSDYSQLFESIKVQDGVFILEVGPCLPNLSQIYYAQLSINQEALSPRTKLLTFPVSINSLNSERLSGLSTQDLFLKVNEVVQVSLIDFSNNNVSPALDILTQNLQTHQNQPNNPHTVTKSQVGLSQVDNVQQLAFSALELSLNPASNFNVPSSKAVADHVNSQISMINLTSFELKNSNLVTHLSRVNNPHLVSRAQLSLDLVSNVLQLPMSYLQTILLTNSDVHVPSSSAVATFINQTLQNQTPIFASAFDQIEVNNLKSNTLANGASPWLSNALPIGSALDYLRGDRTFVQIPADQLSTVQVSNITSNVLADGTSPWIGKEDILPTGSAVDYLRGDRTFVQ
ncbi:hypothetical protein MJH12_13745, partial [bacterium]|nr:hypothetical protein [bacterium]